MESHTTAPGDGIGARLRRKEDARLLRGLGRYVDDVPEPPGTLHANFVRSPHAHARIVAIDVEAARRAPGVVAVLTGEQVARLIAPLSPDLPLAGFNVVRRPLVCFDRVRFVGDAVAVVLAENAYAAVDAADLVEVEYEALPAVATIDAALAEGAPLIHDEAPGNLLFQARSATKDFEAVFAAADRRFEETFVSDRVAAVSMEPRGCMAIYDAGLDTFTVWSSTQIPHLLRTSISEELHVPDSRIRVITPDVGGGFGMKASVYPEELVACALAREHGGCVKWIPDRQDDFLTSSHARDVQFTVAMAVTRDGLLQAVRINVNVGVGAYPVYPFGSSIEAAGAARVFPGPYKFQHYAFETRGICTNTCPCGPLRGVAAPVAFFALEGMMDRIGRRLGLDPVEVRRRNLVRPEDFPYVNANGLRYDTGSYVECLDQALAQVDYEGYRRRQPASRLVDGKYRGIGIAAITEQTGQGGARYRARGLLRIPGLDSAHLKIEPAGQAILYVSSATQGQGHLTTFAQLAAEELGLSAADITVEVGDTLTSPFGSGTFASRSAVTGGGAVIRAATRLAAKIRRIAAHLLEVSPDDLDLRDGHARVKGVPAMQVSLRDVARVAYSMSSKELPPGDTFGLEETDYCDPPVPVVGNAVHVVCVAVDPRTGGIEIERYVVVHDCGRIINPLIVEGQTHGAIVQGLGPALIERMVYDENGQPLATTLADYPIPCALDVPDIEMGHIETPAIDSIGGIKGMAESGTIGAVPALANAVGDALSALGITINRIPLRPDTVLALIEGAGGPAHHDPVTGASGDVALRREALLDAGRNAREQTKQ